MIQYIESIETPLFDDINSTELKALLFCLSARVRSYEKNQIVLLAGEPPNDVGIVLSGKVQIVKEDFYGNRTIVSEFGKNNLFGEAFACADIKAVPVSVIAATDCEIMLLDYRKIIKTCSLNCSYHNKIIYNLLRIIADKNFLLDRKIEVLSQRSTRDKLLAYLSIEAKKAGKTNFEIPFDRQQLADYLCVERSAMSTELGKMRDERLINFDRSNFSLNTGDVDKQ